MQNWFKHYSKVQYFNKEELKRRKEKKQGRKKSQRGSWRLEGEVAGERKT